MFVKVEYIGLFVMEGSVVLTCEVYGYPRDPSPPAWSSPGRDLQTCKFSTDLRNGDLLNDGSVSSEERVVSQLSICTQQLREGQLVGRMMLQRLATGATGVKQARYRRRPTEAY